MVIRILYNLSNEQTQKGEKFMNYCPVKSLQASICKEKRDWIGYSQLIKLDKNRSIHIFLCKHICVP